MLILTLAVTVTANTAICANAISSDWSKYGADIQELKSEYRRPTDIPVPEDNSFTPVRAELGRQLFFDPRLSGSGVISCATCHNPALGWEDGLSRGLGHMGTKLGRHSPTIENLAWGGPYFWDGRAVTLEDQAKGPLGAEAEMNMPSDDLEEVVQSIPGYRAAFKAAYPGEPVNIDTIAKAIANFERTVVSGKAPFDRWVEGDETAISDEAKLGFVVFNTKANCAVCHSGWRFTDDGFHDVGINSDDKGRGDLIPGIPVLEHAFKTPTLRNIAHRAPYMHDGSEETLLEVVEFYNKGFVNRESLSPNIKELGLNDTEKAAIVAFLHTLSGQNEPVMVPILPQIEASNRN